MQQGLLWTTYLQKERLNISKKVNVNRKLENNKYNEIEGENEDG